MGTTVTQEGRSAAPIQASLDGGALKLTSDGYGSASGFRIEYGNAATNTELGLGASGTEYTGTDVQGTIGGMAATGSGQVLGGAGGTDVEGLSVQVEDGFTSGSVTYSRGVASQIQLALQTMLGTGDGSIQSITDGLDSRVTSIQDRIDQIDARLDRRKDQLTKQFTAMEQAMSTAQNQSAWLASQIGALPTYSSTGG